jgi:hypothetical protein
MINELKFLVTNYHVIFAIIYFIFTSIFKLFFNLEVEIEWLIKLFGTISGYLFHDIVMYSSIREKKLYIKNLIKYLTIILFQNIFSYMFLHEDIFTFKNALKIELYIFFYIIFDRINDYSLKEGENKDLYSDIIRICLTYLIVEKIFGKEIDKNDMIYVASMMFGLIIFYKYFNKYLIKKLKEFKGHKNDKIINGL